MQQGDTSSPPPRRVFRTVLVAASVLTLLLVLVGGCYLIWLTQVFTPRLQRNVEQRWTGMRRSMREFEKELRLVEENESLRALTRDLRPFGILNLYGPELGAARPERPKGHAANLCSS